MTSTTLYELANARDILDGWLAESDGEVTPELEALLSEVDAKADDKIERVALYIREQKALADAAKVERDRLNGIASARLKAAESLTSYLHREMDRLGKDKVNGVLATIALQKNPPSVKGDLSEEELRTLYASGPAIVKHVPESFVLDRKAALAAHKAGQVLPSGLTIEQSIGLRIR
jgi:hypothetical protein